MVDAPSGRLAEVTIALSLASDLGTGQPMEHGLRTCWLSLAAAEALGLDAATRSAVYYVALLRFIGCTSDASETAVLAGGDDVAFNAAMAPMLAAQPGEGMRYFVRRVAEDLPLHRRAGRVVRALTDPGMERRSLSGHCEVAARLATRLGLPESVCDPLGHAYERWDGKGHPAGLGGEEVRAAVRVVAAARDAELWARQAGWQAAVDVLAHRRGHAHDPAVIDTLVVHGRGWLAAIGDDPCAAVLDAEPAPVATVRPEELGGALAAVADFADLKSPFFRDHSSGVAGLSVAAAKAAGLSDADAADIGRAALVHDVGRVGVPSGIWDRPGPLSAGQWERVRLHPYLSERVLQRCALLAPFAALAARHHERADGTGYHRGASGEQLSLGARVLAAADAYHAMGEDRPHRPALTPGDAAARLLDDVDAGRFGSVEVEAVLDAAGQASRPPRVPRPAGLTEREVDVLRLIARGHANKQVAATLGISPKTVGHHIEHIYAKAGVTTRAGATLFPWSMACSRPDRRWGEHPIPPGAVRSTLPGKPTKRRAMPTIDINDTTLYYERAGQGPAMLFVHGMCGDAEVWADQAGRFSDHYTCVRYDGRGHSRSRRGDATITDTLHAGDAAALIESLGLAPCLLVGSSGGAAIAVEVALRYGHMLCGAVFSEPPLFCLDRDAGQAVMEELVSRRAEATSAGGPRAAVDAFFSLLCPGLWSMLDETRKDRYGANADIGFTDLRSPSLDVAAKDLAAVALPALVLAGDTSHPSLRSVAHRLAEALSDARFVELDNCGHVTYAEQPDAFATAVSVFAAELDRRAAIAAT